MSGAEVDALPDLLRRTADLLRLSGANDFKVAAWERAADVAEREGRDLASRTSEADFKELPNIGSSLAKELAHYLAHGELPKLRELEAALPPGLVDWLDISGLGPKRAARIHQALEIDTLAELKAALEDGRVASLPGFGKKSARRILNALTWMEGARDRCRQDEAIALADWIRDALSDLEAVDRLEIAGSLRRRRETIGDLDVLAAVDADAAKVHARFRDMEGVEEVLLSGDTKTSVRLTGGRQADLRTVSRSAFAAALVYFTGGREHNVLLRGRARERGLTLNEYGLYPLTEGEADRDRPVICEREEDLYEALDLPYVPPEWREEAYREWIESGDLPRPVEAGDLKGVLHVHSTWSDGKHGLEELADACRELGYGYLGVTDHSQSAFYANGLKPDRVEAQWREIDELNRRWRDEGVGFRIFKGIESDILPDGSLDYSDDLLAGFDFVIASLHGRLDMEPEAMRERVETAIRHPAVTLLGHPTARILLRRPGAKLDMEAVIRLAAERGVGIELNCAPARLELDWRWGPLARKTGLVSAICPDAHARGELRRIREYGVPLARKAGFEAERILNTLEADDLAARLRNAKRPG